MYRFQIFIFLMLTGIPIWAQDETTVVPFTLVDRDRILRTEQKVEALSKSVDERFDALSQSVDERFDAFSQRVDERFEGVQKQLDNIFNMMLFLLGGIMGLIGFVLYDRKTILKPVTRKQDEMEQALIDYSKKNKGLRDALKKAGIL